MGEKEEIWGGTWELDGNTGNTAAICEMLVQSQDNLIQLLLALPDDWKEGEIRGICLRGDRTAYISWKDGEIEKAVIYSKHKDDCCIKYKNNIKKLNLNEGCKYIFDAALNYDVF
ncbi:MAG TPA: hypothetical protein VN258_04840 [Mobilitalea sp.]|nr:hypothetical protein [Mobilitalea sp.]